MKKVIVIAILFLLVGASFASGQTTTLFTGKLQNPDRTGPFTVTLTKQKDTGNGGQIFVTKVNTVGGGSAHFDITIDDVTGYPTSIDIYGYTKQPSDLEPIFRHLVTCSGSEFVQIATDPDGDPYPHIEDLKSLSLCAFNPNGLGETTDGIAYLQMGGTLRKLTDQPTDIEKFVLNGTLGGAYNQADNKIVFKGSFGTVLKPSLQ